MMLMKIKQKGYNMEKSLIDCLRTNAVLELVTIPKIYKKSDLMRVGEVLIFRLTMLLKKCNLDITNLQIVRILKDEEFNRNIKNTLFNLEEEQDVEIGINFMLPLKKVTYSEEFDSFVYYIEEPIIVENKSEPDKLIKENLEKTDILFVNYTKLDKETGIEDNILIIKEQT